MSQMRKVRAQREVEVLLDATGLPYTIECGRKHRKIILDGRRIGVISHNAKSRSRDMSNIAAHIKREAGRPQPT